MKVSDHCLVTVALAGAVGPAPPPEAVAILVTETAVMSFCVIAYVTWQVTTALGGKCGISCSTVQG